MGRNYEVFGIIKSNLTAEEKRFINNKINELKDAYHIKQDQDTFFGEKMKGQEIYLVVSRSTIN